MWWVGMWAVRSSREWGSVLKEFQPCSSAPPSRLVFLAAPLSSMANLAAAWYSCHALQTQKHTQWGDGDREGDWVQQDGSKEDSKVFYALLLPGKWRWNKDSHSQKRHTTHLSLLLVMWGDRERGGVEIVKEGEKERKNRRGLCIMRAAVVYVCMPECSPHFGEKASHIADLPWRTLSPFPLFYFRLKVNLQYVYPNHHVLVWLKLACAYSTSRLGAAGKSSASLLTVLQCSNLQC